MLEIKMIIYEIYEVIPIINPRRSSDCLGFKTGIPTPVRQRLFCA